MSRTISDRHVLEGVLRAETPLHIGASTAGFATDMELVRDGRGRLLLPGTSLAGALRAALRRTDKRKADHPWWGDAAGGGAARIVVEDAPRRGGTDDDIAVRDGVALDQRHASALDHLLFSREIINPGALFDLHLSIDAAPGASAEGRALLDAIVTMLAESGIDIGAASSRGLGRIRLVPAAEGQVGPHRRWVEERSTAAGMLALLGGTPDARSVVVPAQARPDPGTVHIEIRWQPTTPVMSTQAISGSAVDTVPALAVDPDDPTKLRFLLAGTGLAGAFSARVQRIARTLAASASGFDGDPDDRERDSLPGAVDLFGSPGKGRADRGVASAVTVADCLGTARIDRQQWLDLVESAHLQERNGDAQDGQAVLDRTAKAFTDTGALSVATHNGIDRWTGGASDGLLFTVAEPRRMADWEPLRMRVDVGMLEHTGRGEVAWALLLLGLKALAGGRMPVGGLVTRGLGTIAVKPEDVRFTASKDLPAGGIGAAVGQAGTLSRALRDPDLIRRLNAAIDRSYPKIGQVA